MASFKCPGCGEEFGTNKQMFHYHLNSCAEGVVEAVLSTTEIADIIDESTGGNDVIRNVPISGERAFMSGFDINSCPFSPLTKDGEEWLADWSKARIKSDMKLVRK